ncbi:MAG: AsmA-like C-terminal region-containing protein [Planctomycetota bacterium]
MSGKEAEAMTDAPSGRVSRWMTVALLIACTVFLVRAIVPTTLGEQARRHVESLLRDHYQGLHVSIGRGRLEPSIGLILEDIRIAVPTHTVEKTRPSNRTLEWLTDTGRELVQIDQLVIAAEADPGKLLQQENPLSAKRIRIEGLHLSAWEDAEAFSIERLWPLPSFGEGVCPRIEIVRSSLAFEGAKGQQPVTLQVAQALVLQKVNALQTNSSDQLGQRSTKVAVSGSTSFVDRISLKVHWDGDRARASTQLQGIHLQDSVFAKLPTRYAAWVRPLLGFQCAADADVSLHYEPGKPLAYSANARIHDGRYLSSDMTLPLRSIRGRVSCDAEGIHLEACQAYWGDTRLTLAGRLESLTTPLDAEISIDAENLVLDQRLAAMLPERYQLAWQKLQPRGAVDIRQANLKIRNGKIAPSATIHCKGVDVSYHKFPYPVTQLSGVLHVEGNRVRSELMSGRTGGSLMQCLFDLPLDPKKGPQGTFSAALDSPIAIDDELIQALSPRGEATSKLESFVRSLRPRGGIQLSRGTLRIDGDGHRHQEMDLRVIDGALRYQKFPYSLYNVSGQIRVDGDLVQLSGFHASNANGGSLRCEGHYRLASKSNPKTAVDSLAGPPLSLHFDASRIAFDKALRNALPETSRKTWDSLWPSGVLDSMRIRLLKSDRDSPIDLSIVGQQFESNRIGSDTLRLLPTALPYRLDIVEGLVRYENEEVVLDSIRAEHGRSSVSADGTCRRLPNGRWLLAIDVHSGSRLIPDSELIEALPEQMRGAIRGLNLRGAVGLSGLSETLLSSQLEPNPIFGWDMRLQLEGNRIGEVGPVHGLRGELSMRGRKDQNGLIAGGEISLDSMHINDIQLTQLRGPFEIRDDQLRLGGRSDVTPATAADASPNPIQGRLFDGQLRLRGDVKLSDASFDVGIDLEQAKIPTLLAELGQTENDLAGTFASSMKLEGLLGTTDLLRGRGRATVENANLYQLPVLVQLLNVFSITPNEDVAFTNAETDFRLSEEQIDFEDLKLWGSLILLHGGGSLDRRRELDLTFDTAVSPRNTFTRILRPITGQNYTFWTVDVTGPLQNPSAQRRALDGVGQTLERLLLGTSGGAESKRKDRNAGIGKMFR